MHLVTNSFLVMLALRLPWQVVRGAKSGAVIACFDGPNVRCPRAGQGLAAQLLQHRFASRPGPGVLVEEPSNVYIYIYMRVCVCVCVFIDS